MKACRRNMHCSAMRVRAGDLRERTGRPPGEINGFPYTIAPVVHAAGTSSLLMLFRGDEDRRAARRNCPAAVPDCGDWPEGRDRNVRVASPVTSVVAFRVLSASSPDRVRPCTTGALVYGSPVFARQRSGRAQAKIRHRKPRNLSPASPVAPASPGPRQTSHPQGAVRVRHSPAADGPSHTRQPVEARASCPVSTAKPPTPA